MGSSGIGVLKQNRQFPRIWKSPNRLQWSRGDHVRAKDRWRCGKLDDSAIAAQRHQLRSQNRCWNAFAATAPNGLSPVVSCQIWTPAVNFQADSGTNSKSKYYPKTRLNICPQSASIWPRFAWKTRVLQISLSCVLHDLFDDLQYWQTKALAACMDKAFICYSQMYYNAIWFEFNPNYFESQEWALVADEENRAK